MTKAKIIDGRALAQKIRHDLALEVSAHKRETGKNIGLAVIYAGDDEPSKVYVANKIKACGEAGMKSYSYHFESGISEGPVIALIEALNTNPEVNGILVQLPLPEHLDAKKILSKIRSEKDVDGFHALNAGNLLLGNDCLAACTPSGCIELIESTGTVIEGKHAVVVGRSNIVGKPVSVLLLHKNATVTICHSKTENLSDYTRRADILVAAVGRPRFVIKDMVKSGAVVIDVGINRVDGKLCGDVDFEGVCEVASHISPVPGGAGPMTIAMLLKNTVKAAKLQREGKSN